MYYMRDIRTDEGINLECVVEQKKRGDLNIFLLPFPIGVIQNGLLYRLGSPIDVVLRELRRYIYLPYTSI